MKDMYKMKFDKPEKGRFFKQKGFYIALAVCLIAMGAATWSAVNQITPVPVGEGTTAPATSEVQGVEKKSDRRACNHS